MTGRMMPESTARRSPPALVAVYLHAAGRNRRHGACGVAVGGGAVSPPRIGLTCFLANSGSGRPKPMSFPWFQHPDLFRVFSAQGVEHDVVVIHDGVEIAGAVVDDDVRTESRHPVDVRGARCRGHAGTEMLGQLNRDGSQAAGAGMDENLLTRLQIGSFDKGLPRGQSDEGEGCRLLHGEPGRLERGESSCVIEIELGEGADSILVRPGVDLVSGLEAAAPSYFAAGTSCPSACIPIAPIIAPSPRPCVISISVGLWCEFG